MVKRDTVIVFSGSGVSADSGVPTFRDNGGLWEGYKVQDVATPNAFKKNPQLVWDFYRMRHQNLKPIEPNVAHYAIAKLEEQAESLGFKFILATQNVDRLHQKAGSKMVLELHGNLHDVKCSKCEFIDSSQFFWDFEDIPSCPNCGAKLRPNIVWFGEALNSINYQIPMDAAEHCHSVLVVGAGMSVFPAANIANSAAMNGAMTYESNISSEMNTGIFQNYTFVKGRAADTVPAICKIIYNKLITDKRI